jgi:transcriptional regulator with XRE-family HTH domain
MTMSCDTLNRAGLVAPLYRLKRQMSSGGSTGSRIQAARKRLGWTREALAYHSGISWSAISQVESGRRINVRPSTLAALSRSLGVSIDYLVDGGQSSMTMLNHCEFPYRSEHQFQATMGAFLADGVERSEAILAVTTGPNIELLREYLGREARSVEFIDSSRFYSTPTAALAWLKAFTHDSLGRGASWVRILGEPRWATKSVAEVHLWTRYESLVNLVFAASPLTVCCPYDERSVAQEILTQAHLTHPHAISGTGSSQNPDYADPGTFALRPSL